MSVSIKYKGEEIASASTEVTKTIKTAGKYCESDILVENTPDGGDAPVINPLSVTANGTYTAPSGVDGYSPVTVNVPQGITPTGNINITENGTYDVTEYAEAVVNVSGGGGGISRTYLGSFIKDGSNSSQTAIAAIDWSDGLIFNALMFCPSNNLTSGKLIPYLSDSTTTHTSSGIFFQNGNVGGDDFGSILIGTTAFAIEARASADTRTVVIDYSRWAGGFGRLFCDKTINVYACTIDFGGAEA